jgi:phenylacetate-CoA ligase
MTTEQHYCSENRETMSDSERRQLQNTRLAHRSTYYYENAPIIRQLWDEAGVSPDDVETTDDLQEVPLFRKSDAREYMMETDDPFGGRRCKPMVDLEEDGAFFFPTSGTTGVPTNLIYSARDMEIMTECQQRVLHQLGLEPGDRFFSWNAQFHVSSQGMRKAAEEMGLVHSHADHNLFEVDRFLHVLEYFEPKAVSFVSPPIVAELNSRFEEEDIDPMELFEPVESVVYTGGPLIPDVHETLETEWGVDIYEWLGGGEPGWFPAGCSERKNWGHVADDYFHLEILDPETGERLGEGERGELVITSLGYDGMAHVRWAHDDIAEIERGKCDCGRTTTRVFFYGRVDDLVRVQGEDILPWDVLPIVNRIEEMPSNYFQFYEDSEESLRMRIALKDDRVDEFDAFASEVHTALEDELAVPVDIEETVTEAEMGQEGPGHKIPRVV